MFRSNFLVQKPCISPRPFSLPIGTYSHFFTMYQLFIFLCKRHFVIMYGSIVFFLVGLTLAYLCRSVYN